MSSHENDPFDELVLEELLAKAREIARFHGVVTLSTTLTERDLRAIDLGIACGLQATIEWLAAHLYPDQTDGGA